MNSELRTPNSELSCPYCNAELANDTAVCPRCGEGRPGNRHEIQPQLDAPVRPHAVNRRVGLLVFGLMLLMASIGLTFALATQAKRRANDNKGQDRALPPGPIAADSSEFPGLGFMPSDVHAIAGVDLARVRQSPAGEELLRRLKFLEAAALGPHVDFLLLGMRASAMPPRLTLIAHSPSEAHAGQLRSQLVTGPETMRGERVLFPSRLARVPGATFFISEANRQTLVAAPLQSDFDAIPRQPPSGTERFQRLRETFSVRLPRNVAGWLVADIEQDNTVGPALLNMFAPTSPEARALQQIRGVALSVRPLGADLDVTLDIRGVDAAATTAIADAIEKGLGGAGVVVSRKADGQWQRLTAKLDAASIKRWLDPSS